MRIANRPTGQSTLRCAHSDSVDRIPREDGPIGGPSCPPAHRRTSVRRHALVACTGALPSPWRLRELPSARGRRPRATRTPRTSPVERHAGRWRNTPGPFYFDLGSVQEKSLLVTYFADGVAGEDGRPALRQYRGGEPDVFPQPGGRRRDVCREVADFNGVDPTRWGYKVLGRGSADGVLQRCARPAGHPFLAPWHNTIVQSRSRVPRERRHADDRRCTDGGPHAAGPRPGERQVQHQQRAVDHAREHSSRSSDFQWAMANGELVFLAQDADGANDIDWNTFRMFVAGIDKTARTR